MVRRIHLEICGTVQMVGFRFFAIRTAEGLGITGSVRNTVQGSVEIEAQGSLEALEEFTQAMRKGPPSARVDQVIVTPVDRLREGETAFSLRW